MADAFQIILLLFIAWLIVAGRNTSWDQLLRFRVSKQRQVILDSCALIDGRIIEVTNNGFMSDELIIPQFILNELQMLADGHDSHKRERARFGLDIAHQLQDTGAIQVTIDRTVFPDVSAIDDKLIQLAKKLNAALYTTDYNLGKVAAVESVSVLNINELARALRPISLPGETLTIKITQKGSNHDQGVGYLEDGTMIVVDGAARYVNRTVPVTVTRMHQTVAGKMVFGQVRKQQPNDASNSSNKSRSKNLGSSLGVTGGQSNGSHKNKASSVGTSGPAPKVKTTVQSNLHDRLHKKPARRPVQ